MGMRPILWQARLGRARVLRERGEQAAARADIESAERTVGEITSTFQSEEHREAYRESIAKKIGAIA
jgi:hypothetical protein